MVGTCRFRNLLTTVTGNIFVLQPKKQIGLTSNGCKRVENQNLDKKQGDKTDRSEYPKQNSKRKFFAIGCKSESHWTCGLMYFGNGDKSKRSSKGNLICESSGNLEVLPRLRSSASTFFSPGM